MIDTELVPGYMLSDLANSGLDVEDVRGRVAGPGEKQATNTPIGVNAYVLPYFNIDGKPLPFYRVKLINHEPKYKQLATAPNHVYFPKSLPPLLRGARYILITEGEKKAAAAVKAGFPCVALGGVDSWKNRTVVFHKDTEVGQNKRGQLVAKMPAGSEVTEKVDSLATGFQTLIDLAIRKKIPLIMCFDLDFGKGSKRGVSFDVQRACAMLGYELRHRGMEFRNVRQLIMDPQGINIDKLGIDDFLMHDSLGPNLFDEQIEKVLALPSAFPQHPNPRSYVNKQLQRTHMQRSDVHALGTAILSDMDSKGLRLRCSADDSMYYFDSAAYRLLRVHFSDKIDFAKTPFGIKLYKDYSITAADRRLVTQLASQFPAEEPVSEVRPERILTVRGNVTYIQLSAGMVARVDKDSIDLVTNGTDDVLFETDALMEDVDPDELKRGLVQYSKWDVGSLPNLWYPILQETRIKASEEDHARKILSLLYSISPWFYKWRETQLPIEMMTGEAGSGKSTLFMLRLRLLMGYAILRNAPNDLRDWTASVGATGGLHVTDNVHLTNPKMKQELSDELCRIITEPDPHVERRKLYSDNELVRTAIKSVFAITSIQQPFTNTDIIQRSIITELDKGTIEVTYDADWANHQMARYGGRAIWLAQQLVFIQRMYQLIDKEWQKGYKAKFRLINVEQLLILAAKVYGMDQTWIAEYLEKVRDIKTEESDYALQGLCAWAQHIRNESNKKSILGRLYTVGDIVEWAMCDLEFEKNHLLTNGRSLGSYMNKQQNTISMIAGIEPANRKINNRTAYRVRWIEPLDEDTEE